MAAVEPDSEAEEEEPAAFPAPESSRASTPSTSTAARSDIARSGSRNTLATAARASIVTGTSTSTATAAGDRLIERKPNMMTWSRKSAVIIWSKICCHIRPAVVVWVSSSSSLFFCSRKEAKK